MIEFEVALVFYTTLFFAILYFFTSESVTKLLLGVISVICWFTLSFTFFAMPATYQGVSWFFMGIGIVFMLLTGRDVFLQIKEKKGRLEP